MKKGFSLVEVIAVIAIISSIIVVIAISVENNIKDSSDFGNNSKIEMIESAAQIYAEEYTTVTDYEIIDIEDLVSQGLLKAKSVEDFDDTDKILIAIINNKVRVKYIKEEKPVIFLTGDEEVTVYKDKTYTDAGAYLVVPNCGTTSCVSPLVLTTSTVDTAVVGNYTVTFTYTNATSVIRKVSVIE